MTHYVKLMHTTSSGHHQVDWCISSTADWTTDPGTTPPENAPPGMAMATCAPTQQPQNALIDMADRDYAFIHNAHVHSGPPVSTGSRTLDRTLGLAPCRVCGSGDDLLTIWYDDKPDTVCGACFAWACQAMQTIKVQKFYV